MNPSERVSEWLDLMRLRMARPDALVQLTMMALVTGLLTGTVIVLFRLAVEYTQNKLLSGQGPDAFEALPGWGRLVLPLLGAVLLALMFRWFGRGLHVLGVARLLERMAYHQGRLTVRGFLLQLVGVAIAIISGHSVGREGAHIFLGAATGSLLGQRLELPNNAVRTLVGCGTAAGIAASFNTPLAGVIFSLEVIMMDYQLASFIPVIIAAVTATVVSNLVLGNAAVFSVPMLELGSLKEIFFVVILGLLSGAMGAGFIQMVKYIAAKGQKLAVEWQMLAAGLITGLFGMAIPEVMGIGYDTINAALLGGYTGLALLMMAAAKIFATGVCSGLNVPGGMIGPALFIGATLGGGFGHMLDIIFPQMGIQPGIYAMLGMSALMAASLQAPLAALTALLELTDNAQIIMPGMLVVVIAGLTASEVFHQESLFITMLKAKGLDYKQSPIMNALLRVGVASAMDREFQQADRVISLEKARTLLAGKPRWLLIKENKQPETLLSAIDLAAFIESEKVSDEIDLMEIPGNRYHLEPVNLHQTVQEALEKLNQGEGEALYVRRMAAPGIWRVYGVLTREMIRSAYDA